LTCCPFPVRRKWPLLLCLWLACALQASAQLCTGSLGDPVVNIDFDRTTPSNQSAINYSYVGHYCPNDGSYTYAASTSGCFGNAWHTVPGDHTGGGRFMLVNASFDPGDFYVDTVSGLCAGTTYEFAAWVINVLNRSGIRPNVTFRIELPDGTVLQEYQTGDISSTPTPTWKQYGFYFATPANEARIVLRITNNAPGGNGNDLGLDDITFRPCGPPVTARIEGAVPPVDACHPDNTTYRFTSAVSADYTQPRYQWQLSENGGPWTDIPGATGPTYQRNPTGPGAYRYRMTVVEENNLGNTACRIASDAIDINIHPRPVVDAGPDRSIILGRSTFLAGSAQGESLTYLWTPGTYLENPTLLQPRLKPQSDTRYTLTATSPWGCSASDSVQVRVLEKLLIPNAFTPNGDGRNDTWSVPFLDPTLEAEVRVFNRFGQLVFHARSAGKAWDGTVRGVPQPSGVYVYLVRFREDNSLMKGTLTLVR
jgi:gliding motility-associated-like protein